MLFPYEKKYSAMYISLYFLLLLSSTFPFSSINRIDNVYFHSIEKNMKYGILMTVIN